MGEITLRQALEEYKAVHLPARNFTERTRVEYTNDIESLVQFLGQLSIKRIGEVGLNHLNRYLAELDYRGVAGLRISLKLHSKGKMRWWDNCTSSVRHGPNCS